MRPGSRLALRKSVAAFVAVAATLALTSAGYSFSRTWFIDTPVPPEERAAEEGAKGKPKSQHPPVAGVRDRVLANFHGQTTKVFTALPGFGDERMVPLYKYVPFEVPDLSTNEVEVEKEVVAPEVL